MKAPKCKICGDEHYGLCSFKAEKAEAEKAAPGKEPVSLGDGGGSNRGNAKRANDQVLSGAKPKFDRNAYQRELMRKRRAAAKNANN